MKRLFESTLAPAVRFQNIWNKVDHEELGTHVHSSTSLRADVSIFFIAKRKGNRRPHHEGFSGTKSFTDGGIYNTCFLLLRRKPCVPGVRIVECGAKEESEKHTLPHPLVVFFSSHLFALSPRSERLEQATT